MSRILVPNDGPTVECWFDEIILIASHSEADFERLIRQHMNNVFPEFITISYSDNITDSNMVTKRADTMMLKRDYSEWWVVEIEKGMHNLQHVLDQVTVFQNGNYNQVKTSKTIIKNYKNEFPDAPPLDQVKLQELIKTQQPNVLVVADMYNDDWVEKLNNLGIKYCIFEVYKNTNGRNAFRLFGEHPEVRYNESHCVYAEHAINTLVVLSPAALNIPSGVVEISYNGKISRWSRLDYDGEVHLRFVGSYNIVPQNKEFVLFRDSENKLILKLN